MYAAYEIYQKPQYLTTQEGVEILKKILGSEGPRNTYVSRQGRARNCSVPRCVPYVLWFSTGPSVFDINRLKNVKVLCEISSVPAKLLASGT